MSDTPSIPPAGPLAGIKVLELGQLIAGPFAAKVLSVFGLEDLWAIMIWEGKDCFKHIVI